MYQPQTDPLTRSDTAPYRPSTRIKYAQKRPPFGNFFFMRRELRLSPEIDDILVREARARRYKTVSGFMRSFILTMFNPDLSTREKMRRLGFALEGEDYTANERHIMRRAVQSASVERYRNVGKNTMSYEDMLWANEQERRREHLAACRPVKAPAPVPVKEAPAPVPVKEAPAPVPVKEAPAPAPVEEAPAPVPVKEAPAPAPVEEAPAPVPVKEAPAPAPVEEIEERFDFTPRLLELVTRALAHLPEHTLQRLQQEARILPQEALESQIEALLDLYNPVPLVPRKKLLWRDLS